jgi:hypothetical protein
VPGRVDGIKIDHDYVRKNTDASRRQCVARRPAAVAGTASMKVKIPLRVKYCLEQVSQLFFADTRSGLARVRVEAQRARKFEHAGVSSTPKRAPLKMPCIRPVEGATWLLPRSVPAFRWSRTAAYSVYLEDSGIRPSEGWGLAFVWRAAMDGLRSDSSSCRYIAPQLADARLRLSTLAVLDASLLFGGYSAISCALMASIQTQMNACV